MSNVPTFKYKANGARDFFQKNLPVVSVYKKFGDTIAAFVVKKVSGVEWAQLIENVHADQLVKEEIKGKLAGLIKPSLKYAGTERDRQIL